MPARPHAESGTRQTCLAPPVAPTHHAPPPRIPNFRAPDLQLLRQVVHLVASADATESIKQRTLDQVIERAYELGMGDLPISKSTGMPYDRVVAWRKQAKLPSNQAIPLGGGKPYKGLTNIMVYELADAYFRLDSTLAIAKELGRDHRTIKEAFANLRWPAPAEGNEQERYETFRRWHRELQETRQVEKVGAK